MTLICLLQVNFKQEVKCKAVCTKTYKKGTQEDVTKLDFLKMGMQLNYQHHWFALSHYVVLVIYSGEALFEWWITAVKQTDTSTSFFNVLTDVNQSFFQDH